MSDVRTFRSPCIALVSVFILSTAGFLLPAPGALASQGGTGGGPISGSVFVKVVEAGTDDGTGEPLPISGAFVMVGEEAGVPFAANTGTTDGSGQILFNHPALFGPQTVTAGAAGFRYFSFVDVNASQIVIPLQLRNPTVPTSRVTGSLSSFPGVDCDDYLQLALVTPLFGLDALIGFSLAHQLSENVPVDILGDTVYLPGNLVIPSQKEWPENPLMCLFLGATIAKTGYLLNLPTGTVQDIFGFGLQAHLPSLLSGTLELSQMTPLKAGIGRNVSVTGNRTANINMSHTLSHDLILAVGNTPAGSDVLLLSLGEINGDPALAPGVGGLMVLGFSVKPGGQTTGASLTTVARTAPFADLRYVGAAIAAFPQGSSLTGVTGMFDRGNFVPPVTRWMLSFLFPVQLDPVVGNLFSFSDARQPGASPQPHMNFSHLAHITTVPDTRPGAQPGATVDLVDRCWTLTSPGSSLALHLPILPPAAPEALPFTEQTPANDRLEWEHTVVVQQMNPAFNFNSLDLMAFKETFTHFSANSRTFSVDSDGDGVHLFQDNCPFLGNPDQTDTDGDGVGDACDNCPFVWNPDQTDTNGNGIGDACDPSMGCLVDADCDDGNVCNGIETCVAGVCEAGPPLVCDDGNVCTDNLCDLVSGCVFANNTAPCDDGDACTAYDTCSGGQCVGGPPLVCDDGLFCSGVEWCDPVLGCLVGTNPCDDQNPCTNDTCTEESQTCQYSCNAANWQDACCQDQVCVGAPICEVPACFIATASFGTEMTGKVDLLRQFRDEVLLASEAGSNLVKAYYRTSPPLAEFIQERPAVRTLVRALLLPVVGLASLLLLS